MAVEVAGRDVTSAPPPRRTPWFGLAGWLLLAALVAAVVVQVRQYALLSQTVQEQDDFAVLSLYPLEVEFLRLREQLRRPDALDERRAELQLRYDIFLSRIDLLKAARASRLLGNVASSQATLRAIETFVGHAEVYLGVEPRGALSATAAAALTAELDRLGEPIHQLLLDATHHVAAQITARREVVRQHNVAGLALTGLLSVAVLIFGAIALRQMRQLEARRLHLERLAAELRDARVAAESANAAKSSFLADMSHELRTPLHGLRGMLGLARDAAPRDPRAAQWLATADESAAHLQTLLDDVLDLSRLEAGALELVPSAVPLPALVRDICALLQPQATAKGLRLDAGVSAELPAFVMLDPTRTRQVLFNLLQNAIKYSEAGTVTLRCRLASAADGRPMIEFAVADDGIGMDSAVLERLFQRYERAADPLAQRQPGTGLGLAISRKLARLMGGDVVVRSSPGAGSVFTFQCTLLPATTPAPPPVLASATLRRSLQVLVAEDHPINRLYLGALLERLGHQVQHAEDGRQAVDAAASQAFDLILMDVHMPVMDGVAATAAIRAQPGGRDLRIVALTADVFADTRQRCEHAGVDEVLTKPVSLEALSALLQRHFGEVGQPLPEPCRAPPSTPSLAPDLQLLDRGAQADVRETMGAQRCRALYAGLFEQAADATRRMREAMREADVEALRQLAHSVKGAALNLGLPALASAAETISGGAQAMAAPQLALAVQRFDEMVQATRTLCAAEGLIGE